MTNYPNDQATPAAAIPVRLVNAAGNAFYDAGGGGGVTPATPYHLSGGSSASVNATLVSDVPVNLVAMVITNESETKAYVRLFNQSTTPDPIDDAGNCVWSVGIPPGASSGLMGGIAIPLPEGGIAFTVGLGFVITGGGADNDSSNAPAGVYINLGIVAG